MKYKWGGFTLDCLSVKMAVLDLLSTKGVTAHDMNRYSAIFLARWRKGPTCSFFSMSGRFKSGIEKSRVLKKKPGSGQVQVWIGVEIFDWVFLGTI